MVFVSARETQILNIENINLLVYNMSNITRFLEYKFQ